MISIRSLNTIFQSLPQASRAEDDPDNPAALPNASLDFLVWLANAVEAKTAFEFGSGRSTHALLRAGLAVTSLEDSEHWMEQTVAGINPIEKARHHAVVRPLRLRFRGLIPVMDWILDADLKARLSKADLILVDSPYFTPFRESTLWQALNGGNQAVIVLDDTRIPTVSRFCERIAACNPGLLHRRVPIGHTFDVFSRPEAMRLRDRHTPTEVIKGWRRFILRNRLLKGGGQP